MKVIKNPIISIILFVGLMLIFSCTSGGVYSGKHCLNGERNKVSVVGVEFVKWQERLIQLREYNNQGEARVA